MSFELLALVFALKAIYCNCPPTIPPISYTVIKNILIGLASWALFSSHKIYFYMFWPNLYKFFAEGHDRYKIYREV